MKWKTVLTICILFCSLSTIKVEIGHTQSSLIRFENESDFAVTNLTFDNVGIYILNCRRFVIANNTFINVKNAIRIEISLGQISENFVIANNTFIGSGENEPLLILFGSPGNRGIRDFIITNNILMNSGKIGAAFAENGVISCNTILNSSHGIATRGVSNITIERNFVENCGGYGIYLGTQIGDFGTNNVTIKENHVIANNIGIARWYGSEPVKNVKVENNRFVNSTTYDVKADFSGKFINNVITSKSKVKLVDPGAMFIGTKGILGEPIQPSDVDEDGKVDIRDIAIVAKAYGSYEGTAGWNPQADIIADGHVDIRDISFAAKHFGLKS